MPERLKFIFLRAQKKITQAPIKLSPKHYLIQHVRKATQITLHIVKNPAVPFKSKEILVVLTDDQGLKRVKGLLWGQPEISDVVSVSYGQPPLCEIIINEDQARRQTPWGLQEEILFLYIHGLLHILGYDDNTLSKRSLMLSLGTKILYKTLQSR
ncbi:MAG: rRNA maturation RNAse YbeY [Elusimicrobia bacterium]|nr:rRNA maturation RNAse YbeY [Elusimicrobiota bacterium]